MHEYVGRETRRFITFNAQLRAYYTLPGVFGVVPTNSSLSAVNGSWWTIPLEARCYAYVAILGAIGLRRRIFSLLALLVVALMYAKTLPGHSQANTFDNLCYFYTAFFFAGEDLAEAAFTFFSPAASPEEAAVAFFAGALRGFFFSSSTLIANSPHLGKSSPHRAGLLLV